MYHSLTIYLIIPRKLIIHLISQILALVLFYFYRSLMFGELQKVAQQS